jgi:uncharacterized repeat protein (TIGR04052 family)
MRHHVALSTRESRTTQNRMTNCSTVSSCLLATMSLALSACASETPSDQKFEFSLVYNGEGVGCGDVLEKVGLSESTVELRDARIYLHELEVLFENGERESLQLEDSEWQREGVVLLDFADDTGLCDTGSPATNHSIIGTTENDSPIAGLSFKVGLPYELNHLDAARAAAPLNAAGMAWSWTGGYKYARIDAQTTENENWYVHLGATGCEGSPAEGIDCSYSNLTAIEVALDEGEIIEFDLNALYAKSDLDAQIDMVSDFINGCMAFGGDPECDAIFEAFGMSFESDEPLTQSVFKGASK